MSPPVERLRLSAVGMDDGSEAIFLVGEGLRVSPTQAFVNEVGEALAPEAIELR